jgi:hypothetical protein
MSPHSSHRVALDGDEKLERFVADPPNRAINGFPGRIAKPCFLAAAISAADARRDL